MSRRRDGRRRRLLLLLLSMGVSQSRTGLNGIPTDQAFRIWNHKLFFVFRDKYYHSNSIVTPVELTIVRQKSTHHCFGNQRPLSRLWNHTFALDHTKGLVCRLVVCCALAKFDEQSSVSISLDTCHYYTIHLGSYDSGFGTIDLAELLQQ